VNDEWMSVEELCAWLRIKPQTLYNARYAHGEPRGVRVGRELRFRRAEIELWLRSISES
jgi:excisionase family DNA binding protein